MTAARKNGSIDFVIYLFVYFFFIYYSSGQRKTYSLICSEKLLKHLKLVLGSIAEHIL